MGYVRALRVLHRAFSKYPFGHRLHILIRFLTCPFLRALDEVPLNARVLEIGSGHALYAFLIAETRAREVVGVDPDLGKSFLPSPSPKVKKIAGYDDCIRGAFDAIAMADVAYRIAIPEQRALFARIFERLVPGGVLVLKELDPESRWKMRWARAQEWLSDTFLGITAGEGFFYQTRKEVEVMLSELGFTSFEARRIDHGYPHAHIVYTARKPT